MAGSNQSPAGTAPEVSGSGSGRNISLDGYNEAELVAAQALLELFSTPRDLAVREHLHIPSPASTNRVLGDHTMAPPPSSSPPPSSPPPSSPPPSSPPPSSPPPSSPPPPPSPPGPARSVNVKDVRDRIAGHLAEWVQKGMRQEKFRDAQIQQIVNLSNAMRSSGSILDAMMYLEFSNWDLGAAFQQCQYDEKARAARRNTGRPDVDPNHGLDRQPALRTEPFKIEKLSITVKKGKKWVDHDYYLPEKPQGMSQSKYITTYKKEATAKKFPSVSPTELLRINRWRNRVLRRVTQYPPKSKNTNPVNGGSEKSKANKVKVSEWWHPFEKRYLDRLFAEVQGEPDHEGTRRKHNAAFKGMHLPGDARPAPKRRTEQITAYLYRSWTKKLLGASYVKIRQAKPLIAAKYKKELDELNKILDEGQGSTIEDYEMVEAEDEPELKDDGYPLSEKELAALAEPDEDTYPPTTPAAKTPAYTSNPPTQTNPDSTADAQTLSQEQKPPTSFTGPGPEGVLKFGNLELPDEFHEDRDTDDSRFYGSNGLRAERAFEETNFDRDNMTAWAWRRAGRVVMAFYHTRQTLADIAVLNDWLTYLRAPATLRAGTTDMMEMLSWFDHMATTGATAGQNQNQNADVDANIEESEGDDDGGVE